MLLVAPASAAQTFEHRWSGLIYEVHAPNDTHAWTAEDGGRIRRTTDNGANWSFDVTPIEAEHILRDVHVLPDLSLGWAVGEDNTILVNSDPMNSDTWTVATWSVPNSMESDLYDVFFADAMNGWILAKHGFWYTDDGGSTWTACRLFDDLGNLIHVVSIELYAMDIKPGLCRHDCDCTPPCDCPDAPNFGLACAEPGIIYRTLDGFDWYEVFDVRDLCPSGLDDWFMCAKEKICPPGVGVFEAWDIEISDDFNDPLAIMVGGIDTSCGLIFASDDWGCTWTQELHECNDVSPCNPPPNLTTVTPAPLDQFRTIYGVAIDPTDNSAIACGYNAQHLRRPPGAPGTVKWTDHSVFGNVYLVPHNNAVIFPLYGAEFSPDGATGYIVGAGGHVRTTTDDGVSYTEHGSKPGDFRIVDAQFINDTKGFLAGQFFLLAETINGGGFWEPRSYDPLLQDGNNLTAVAFAVNGLNGVAVGELDAASNKPKIKYTFDGGSNWADGTLPDPVANELLTAVAWDKSPFTNVRFWAVGEGGLILETSDGGANWDAIASPAGAGFNMHGVAFDGPTWAVVVGEVGDVGTAFRRLMTSWLDISPVSSLNVKVITDVDVDSVSDTVYAVGAKVIGPNRYGTVLKLRGSRFEELPNNPTIPLCTVGPFIGNWTEPLNAVKLFGTQAFVGGQCGELWEESGGVWMQRRSETNSHILNLSVVSSTGRVYTACWRPEDVHSCITRLVQ